MKLLPCKLLKSAKLASPLLLTVVLFGCSNTPQQDLAAGRDNYFQQNYQASFDRIKKAAGTGDPDAEYALGYMYYYGKGTDQDVELARSWIQKASAQGQPMAAKALALMDSEQVQANVALNPTQARQQAAAKTNARALGDDYKPEPVATQAAADKAPVQAAPSSAYGQQLLANGGYTIQIMSSDKETSINNFMRAHDLNEKSFTYRKNFKGKELHVLVYGDYKSPAEAHRALKSLPETLRANKPWVKSVAQIKSEIIG